MSVIPLGAGSLGAVAGGGGGAAAASVLPWNWLDLGGAGWASYDPAGLESTSSWGETSAFGAAAGVHGLPDVGRDSFIRLGPDGIWTFSDRDVMLFTIMTFDAPTGGTGGGLFPIEFGLVSDRTITSDKLGANKAHLGGFEFSVASGFVNRTVARRLGASSQYGGAFADAIDGSVGVISSAYLNGSQSHQLLTVGQSATTSKNPARNGSTVNLTDGQAVSFALSVGSSDALSSAVLDITNLKCGWFVLNASNMSA